MTVAVRVVRQFRVGAEAVRLAKVLALPAIPRLGARLNLRSEGVEEPLMFVGGIIRYPVPDDPDLRPPRVTMFTDDEPAANLENARAHSWEVVEEGLPQT